ncbi:phosphopyruvate hydratase [Labrys sp. WJW]|nr:phosphopyruvate hydratase [Labrys sp. WJW]OCC05458.1 phosphopyruvate hydratase [Labrys sp. WJW]
MDRSIQSLNALEILDSRGNPTLQVAVRLNDGTIGTASIPSGASTGEHEAKELRDRDHSRFGGLGVCRAVENVEQKLSAAVIGKDAQYQREIDQALIDYDGTSDKSNLGANAILGVSLAVARAAASSLDIPLYAYLGGPDQCRLPVPMMNVINGGKHASNKLAFQEYMIVPHGAPSYREAIRYGAETFRALRRELERWGMSTGVGDEGGFAPDLADDRHACDLIVAAITKAGYVPGRDIAIALDPAATSFFSNGLYRLAVGERVNRHALLTMYAEWAQAYPIVSIEDGFAETDWDGFIAQTASLGRSIQIVGDDLYVTNRRFISEGIERKATNAVLIKPNQIGTLSETIEAVHLCRSAGWNYVISHRSGETEDPFIADLSVALGGGQIKAGSVCRGERIAKYNRLLVIEKELGDRAEYRSPFNEARDHNDPLTTQ